MTRAEAMQLLGVTSFAALARELGITPEAVSQWGDAQIPDRRRLQLLELVRERSLATTSADAT